MGTVTGSILRLFLLVTLLASCLPKDRTFSPEVRIPAKREDLASLESNFPALSSKEHASDWGKEYRIGEGLARELDYYRAITSFKRAQILLPKEELTRLQQIEYAIILTYYLGEKYELVVTSFEESHLTSAGPHFPAFRNLTLILHDSYKRVGDEKRAETILGLIGRYSKEDASEMALSVSIVEGDLPTIRDSKNHSPAVTEMIETFDARALSVSKAKTLQAMLPGAGYYYVGQKASAVTSFLINTLFIIATYQLVDNGHVAAGVVVGSLEAGWYLGGINGAGLAAQEFNERLYEPMAKRTLRQERMIPLFNFNHAF